MGRTYSHVCEPHNTSGLGLQAEFHRKKNPTFFLLWKRVIRRASLSHTCNVLSLCFSLLQKTINSIIVFLCIRRGGCSLGGIKDGIEITDTQTDTRTSE